MERLYNGIVLPESWPPRGYDSASLAPLPVPYLQSRPPVVTVDLGRQLFVDDFLIEETTMARRFHEAAYDAASPVLRPETPLELNGGKGPFAAPFSDGCWWDPKDHLYRLYYHSGWWTGTALAVSEDGFSYTRKMLDAQPGTNRLFVQPEGWTRDGSTIWLDSDDPIWRYKMFHYFRTPQGPVAQVRRSRDGLSWSEAAATGKCGDNTSMFYNPFRRKWVFSIRGKLPPQGLRRRARYYYETDDFMNGVAWGPEDPVFWQRCDEIDCRECEEHIRYSPHLPPQLYHLNCTPYESLMLGLFGILKDFDAADNEVVDNGGFPKHLDLHAAFSRDGFHFSRENRTPFIRSTGRPGDWNRGYLHACGGCCLVSEERLMFPVCGLSGESPAMGSYAYGGASTGLAFLRRDGFASMESGYTCQTLLTRPMTFEEGRYLFINADAKAGYVAAEICDSEGKPIERFAREDCLPACADRVKQPLRFLGGDLNVLRGQRIRIRFYATKASLYAFWFSKSEAGHSGGYVAGGGPDYLGAMDAE